LGILLLALVIVLRIPVHVRASYDQGEMAAWVRFGPVKIQVFPPKPAKKEAASDEGTPDKARKKAKKEPKKKKPKAKINFDQILYSVEELPPILLRALRRVGRRVVVEPLKVHLLVAGLDPADTALLFGKLEAALAASLPSLHQTVRIREPDIRLFLDFSAERMDCIADVGVSIRPWDLLSVGIRAGGSLLKWFLGFRKLASPPPKAQEQSGAAAA